MQLYNTLTRTKEQFVPITPGAVSMYVCGITAYDYCHIGHARSAIAFDVLVRLLRARGLTVRFVRNFTDVDDKIINRANEQGHSCEELSERFILAFHEDMDRLNVLRPDEEPRATAYIEDMQALISRLIEQGKAYPTSAGDVYFRVREFADYGKLSGRSPDDLRSGARVLPGEDKEDPLDFALWKSAKAGEPHWTSPWGEGRPGWHIECSAMSEKTLGLPLDIHGGGLDLIFPHHENEIAQSEACSCHSMAKYWVHNGFVQVDAEKMSKSLGNFKTIRGILEEWEPEVLRFFLLSKHYRSPIDFSAEGMHEAEQGLKRMHECLRDAALHGTRESWKSVHHTQATPILEEFRSLDKAFHEAMDDDCNTAAALGHVFTTVRLVNRVLDDKKLRQTELARDLCVALIAAAARWHQLLGVFAPDSAELLIRLRAGRIRKAGIDAAAVEVLVTARTEARSRKDFVAADAVRDQLQALGVDVRDMPSGPTWDVI